MDRLVTIILAAGKGTRMKSDLVKVLHPIAGLAMLAYPIRAAQQIGCRRIIVVTGHQRAHVEAACSQEGIMFACQEEQLGSGHAVAVTQDLMEGFEGDVLILCGDVPLITAETLNRFVQSHREARAAVSVLSVSLDDPFGYGRIVRDASGNVTAIVEQRDATNSQQKIREINTGLYCCSASFLYKALSQVGTDNDQGEYYLPDIVKIGVGEGQKVQAIETDDFEEVRGINDRRGLAEAEKVMRRRILDSHMSNGVTIIDPDSTYIDAAVHIKHDTVIYPNTLIRGGSTIGSGCIIDINCSITNAVIGNNVHIKPSCVIDACSLEDNAAVGPMAHLRQQTVIAGGAIIGNFVEVKNSTVGKDSKACHLSYLGDATIGAEANIGAGTITCNYDGKKKHPTVIEDNVFVGSNTALVAPVTIAQGAVVGAGSTITENVPENSLAVARSKQVAYDTVSKKESEADEQKDG